MADLHNRRRREADQRPHRATERGRSAHCRAGHIQGEAATSDAKLADNDSATAEVRAVLGLTLHAALTDQPVTVAKNGAIVDLGAILTAGVDYFLSGTPGGICPRADVTTGDDPVRIGMALTTSRLQIDINDPAVTL